MDAQTRIVQDLQGCVDALKEGYVAGFTGACRSTSPCGMLSGLTFHPTFDLTSGCDNSWHSLLRGAVPATGRRVEVWGRKDVRLPFPSG